MKLQVEQAKEHIGEKFPYSYTLPATELGDVTAFVALVFLTDPLKPPFMTKY